MDQSIRSDDDVMFLHSFKCYLYLKEIKSNSSDLSFLILDLYESRIQNCHSFCIIL